MDLAREEKCEFMPFMAPKDVMIKSNKIMGMEFYRTEQNDDGEWVDDTDQICTIKASYIISAFGSSLCDQEGNIYSSFMTLIYVPLRYVLQPLFYGN